MAFTTLSTAVLAKEKCFAKSSRIMINKVNLNALDKVNILWPKYVFPETRCISLQCLINHCDCFQMHWRNNWRVRWKKGGRLFTQNWTLSKTLQISHAVLFRCVKQCSVCFFAEVFSVYNILRMQKSLYLWSHQHVTGKTVISLIIQQNIDLLQRVTLKSVDFRVRPLQFWFGVNVRPQRG